MAAAYAALVSLTHLIEQGMEYRYKGQPIFMYEDHKQMEYLQQQVSFLQEFLEVYSHVGSNNEVQSLGDRIVDAAYAAENIIESCIVEYRLKLKVMRSRLTYAAYPSKIPRSYLKFSPVLWKIMKNIDCIKEELMEIKEKSSVEEQHLVPVVSSRSSDTAKDTVVEYFNDELEQIMDKLTGQSSNLQIIPIVGMGGIGKTTLAKYVYDSPLIVESFYIRGWITMSQEYNLGEMLLGLLEEIGLPNDEREEEIKEYHQLGEELYKHLSGRKYLIIVDDMWSIDVWEKLKLFLPDNNNGSRAMITTRLSNVAENISSSHLYKMNFLDENKSWNLLRRKVFGNVSCPSELEEIGKNIAKRCSGLPLSIVVIGGILCKSEMTRKYWEYVAEYINQIVNSVDNWHWLKILSLSYRSLPIHLKPCFLYMGVYPENCKIRVSELIKLWVAEGFIKSNRDKSLEEVAQDNLKDLTERNLIQVREWGSIGKMKTCSIHDLLRDLCLKEVQKERFLRVVEVQNHAQSVNNERRIVVHGDWSCERDFHHFHHALNSTPLIRSLTCDFLQGTSTWESVNNLKLLRVLTRARTHRLESVLQHVNLRYLKCALPRGASAVLSPISRLWFLQTLILKGYEMGIVAPKEIWEMPLLRHIISALKSAIYLTYPLCSERFARHDSVLKDLQTLSYVTDFKCTEEVLKKIPNIKKLSIVLDSKTETITPGYYCLHNLWHLHKLQSLTLFFMGVMGFFPNIAFPQSLKKLTLWYYCFDWDDITTKVGSLPLLEKLKLNKCCGGAEWSPVEGRFCRLKFLEMNCAYDLECWTADSTHFPLLERLVLRSMWELKDIPSDIGNTLQSIELVSCGSSIIASAKEIIEEQKSLGNGGLRLTVL